MQTYYTITCYQGTKSVWQVTKPSLSSLARFVLASEPHRRNYPAQASIVIAKRVNTLEYSTELDAFGTNNPDIVKQLAKELT